MKTKIITLVLLTAFLMAFGCSKSEQNFQRTGNVREAMGGTTTQRMAVPEPARMQSMDDSNEYDVAREESAASETANLERKLVRRANVSIRVENLEAADNSVTSLMEKYDAYASSTMVEENLRNYSLRVPSPQYDAFLTEMNGMGRLINRFESTEDVTIRYYDLEGRLETKRELLRTFQSYLRRANNIEEILAVEARIADLQYDIEGTGQQLRILANRVDYATIDLTLFGPVATMPNRSVTPREQIRQLFGNFGGFLSTVAVVIIGIVIYGIPVLLLLFFFFWLLFGRIGLMKKLWQTVMGKKQE